MLMKSTENHKRPHVVDRKMDGRIDRLPLFNHGKKSKAPVSQPLNKKRYADTVQNFFES